MIYSKSAFSVEGQADLLIKRGLVADRNVLIFRLKAVNYYRLSGYLYPFRQLDLAGHRLDDFVKHLQKTDGDKHDFLPLWMACELMTCGTTQQLAYGLDRMEIKKVAADYGFPDEQPLSWMKAVITLPNACAHYARIWNRVLGVKPSCPGKNKNPWWHTQPRFPNDRLGFMLTLCYHWLGKISPTSQWKDRLFALFDEYPEIPLAEMGMPPTWRTHSYGNKKCEDQLDTPNEMHWVWFGVWPERMRATGVPKSARD